MEQSKRKDNHDLYPKKIFANQLITLDDLLQFKKQLLDELLIAFRSQSGTVSKRWMKSHEVRKPLKKMQRRNGLKKLQNKSNRLKHTQTY